MKFIDEVIISISSGKGGNGALSFRREKFIPRGGPDGGNGGKGGDIIFKSSSKLNTLYQFRYKKKLSAQNGENGQGNLKFGKKGNDLTIEVPVGTLIIDPQTNEIIHDFTKDKEEYLALKGGRGGMGNKHFATSTHRTPRFAQDGEPSQTKIIKLELKLIADIALIGFPNAGKSTIISKISAAKPKIADYPFTTLAPNIGIVSADFGEPFVVADIPGLISGAHKGIGLGIKFLKHIERTKILAHIIDVSTINEENPLESYKTILNELKQYNKNLLQKKQIIVLNKMDLTNSEALAKIFKKKLKNQTVILISAATNLGLKNLKNEMAKLLNE